MTESAVAPEQMSQEDVGAVEVTADHKLEWKPPERPDWVQRINEEGAHMEI
jgi:hypothetical protein